MVRVGVQDKVKEIVEDVSSVAADAGKKQILRLTDMLIEIIRRKQLSSLFLSRREMAMCFVSLTSQWSSRATQGHARQPHDHNQNRAQV